MSLYQRMMRKESTAPPMLTIEFAESLALKAKLFRGFSDPSRLAILEALRHGAMTVTAVVEATGLSQSNVSNHLACLLDCGLVTREQSGRFKIYQLAGRRVEALLSGADEILGEVAKGVHACPT
jgi:ArsR family transcriptional regulator, cadmium/lead-responsive transcriptional repressor